MVTDNVEVVEDLKALALVSHTFVAGAQSRCFRHLTLEPNTLPKLSAMLSGSPHIGAYVRDLHMNLDIGKSEIHVPLARTLSLLSGVRRTAIAYGDQLGCHWCWSSWAEEMQAALIALLCLPTMRTLTLVRCTDVPVAIIRHAMASYEEVVLQVSHIDLHPIKFVRPGDGKSLKHLELLDYDAEQNLDFHNLMLSAEVTNSSVHLKHLDIILLREGMNELFAKYAVSVESLTINSFCTSNRSLIAPRFTLLQTSPRSRSPPTPTCVV